MIYSNLIMQKINICLISDIKDLREIILIFPDIIKIKSYIGFTEEKIDLFVFNGDLIRDGASTFDCKDCIGYEKDLNIKEYVEKFYELLYMASKIAPVFVIKGNHDTAHYENAYDIDKINNIPNCFEISSKIIEFKGYIFLGLSYFDSLYLKNLKELIKKYKNNLDFIISHNQSKRDIILTEFNVKQFIIKGHCCSHIHTIKNTLFIPSDTPYATLIRFGSYINFENNFNLEIQSLYGNGCNIGSTLADTLSTDNKSLYGDGCNIGGKYFFKRFNYKTIFYREKKKEGHYESFYC